MQKSWQRNTEIKHFLCRNTRQDYLRARHKIHQQLREGDGQSERTNQNVKDTLRIFCNYQQTNWADHRHHPKKRIRRPRIGLAWRSKIEVTESCRKLDLKVEMMLWTTSIYKHVVRRNRQYPLYDIHTIMSKQRKETAAM
jgi:hypothetical protein